MKSYETLKTPRTADDLLEERILSLQGIGAVLQEGGDSGLGDGSGSLLLSGVAQATAAVVIRISTGGEPGDASAAYELSTDGGLNFAAPALIPTTPVVIGSTGARATFLEGGTDSPSFVEGDTYSFQVATPVFDATAWQGESVPARLLEIEVDASVDLDQAIAAIATGAYLRDASGDWVDLHALDVFDEERIEAVFAEGLCILTDTAGVGPLNFTTGQLWAGDADGLLKFNNVEAGTLPLNGSVAITFRAEQPGASWNIGNGGISQLLTPIPGVSITNPSRVSAVTKSRLAAPDVSAALDGTLQGDFDVVVEITASGVPGAATFRYSLDGGTIWVSGLTVPTTPFEYALASTGLLLTFEDASYTLGDTYSFDCSVAWLSQSGVDRESDSSVAARCRAKWATLGVGEPNAALEKWAQDASAQVTKVFSRASESVAGEIEVWIAGPAGAVSAGVVAAVDAYLRPLIPLCATLLTQSASTATISLEGTVYVKAGKLARAQATAYAALANYQAETPIGGNVVNGTGLVSRDVLVGCLTGGTNRSLVSDLDLTGPAADVPLSATAAPLLEVSGLNWVEV